MYIYSIYIILYITYVSPGEQRALIDSYLASTLGSFKQEENENE